MADQEAEETAAASTDNFVNKFKRTYILGAVLIFLLVVLSIQIVIFTKSSGLDIKSYVLNFREAYLSGKKSSASLYIEDKKVKIKFNISAADRLNFLEFSRKMGVDNNFAEGISLDLDEVTRNKLEQVLPLELRLSFKSGGLKFKSAQSPFAVSIKNKALQSAQTKSGFEFATGSGKINLNAQNERDFLLDIKDPGPLLKYATESGQIYLSKKVYGMFPILDNIARIELAVSGKDVSGEILLK